jgi:RNA polymerase sigma factor (sigma-70 family)
MRALRAKPGQEVPRPAGQPRTCGGGPVLEGQGRDADRAVTRLYLTHYRPLVRMAALLVQDLSTAEEIVQDSFVAVHAAWRRRPDTGHALSYLRRSVVDRSRVVLRQHVVVNKLASRLPAVRSGEPGLSGKPGLSGAAGGLSEAGLSGEAGEANIEVERSAFISALWTLPARQREVVVLRYFADLPETEVASATGISQAAVKAQAAQAMSSLRAVLQRAGD